jgi:hypothetical protein
MPFGRVSIAVLVSMGAAGSYGGEKAERSPSKVTLVVCRAPGEKVMPACPVEIVLEAPTQRQEERPGGGQDRFTFTVEGKERKELGLDIRLPRARPGPGQPVVHYITLFDDFTRDRYFFLQEGDYEFSVNDSLSGSSASVRIRIERLAAGETRTLGEFAKLSDVPRLLCSEETFNNRPLPSPAEMERFVKTYPESIYAAFVEAALAFRSYRDVVLRSERDLTLSREGAAKKYRELVAEFEGIYARTKSSFVRQRCLDKLAACHGALGKEELEVRALERLRSEYEGFPLARDAVSMLKEIAEK